MELLLWIYDIYQVRKIYMALNFSHRQIFMSELRPNVRNNQKMAYPDALFFIEHKDIKRAMRKVAGIN